MLVTIYGLILGSFFNVLIYRIPEKKSIAFPPSHCPKCKSPIKIWHNIPVLGYLLLNGKCSYCKQHISLLYPVIELITGLAALALWYLYRNELSGMSVLAGIALFTKATFLLLLIPVTVIDIKHYIIPDQISLTFLALGIVCAFFPGSITPLKALYGILAGGGSLYLVGWIGSIVLKKEAMGGGDIKLMAAAGALFGVQNALLGIVFGALFGSIAGLFVIFTKKLSTNHQIPFGPFLGAGIWFSLFFGQSLLSMYMSFIGM